MRKKVSARFLLVGALALALSALVAILALVPAYVSVRIARASLESSVQAAAKAQGSDQAISAKTQRLITALKPIANATSSPSDTVAKALEQKPAGLSITTITYTGGTKPTAVLTGESTRREAVNAFRDALEKTGAFPKIEVPVAALVGAQDGRFTMTLSGF